MRLSSPAMAEESVPSVVLRSADSSSTSECKLRRTAIGGVVERSEPKVLKRQRAP